MRQIRWTVALAAQTGLGMLLKKEESLTPGQRIMLMCISVGLVAVAGLMSGLTLGLMSMDVVELEVLKRSGTAKEQIYAAAIMPLVSNQHFLLVTLLLCNAAAMEALPLFLDRLADPVTAILISVTAVLVFGEILPQAVCSRYGLAIGYYCAWLVRGLMAVTSPISWPIGKLLDFLLGAEHRALFRRGQLKALVDIHGADEGLGGNLTEDEIKVICGALDLTNKTARKSMTPLNKVFMLPADARLTQSTMKAILASGHSRIPVYTREDRSSVIGLILVKELLQYKTHQEVPVSDVRMRSLPRLPADTPMYDMLKLFQTGRSHMVVLTDTPATARAAAEAAAAAVAAAAAAAAVAEAETGSNDGSVRSGADSPLTSILRRGKSKKHKPQFASPLLQPLPSPGSSWSKDAPPGSGAWIAASVEQEEEQQQQQQQVMQEVPAFGFATVPPDHVIRHNVHQAVGNGHLTTTTSLKEQEMVPGSPSCSRDGSRDSSGSSSSQLDRQPQQQQAAEQHLQQSHRLHDQNMHHSLTPQQPGRSSSSSSAEGCAGSSDGPGRHRSRLGAHVRSMSGPLPSVLAPPASLMDALLTGGAAENIPVPIGIITIEDVIEELMQAEIVDETDLFVDNERSITVNAAALAQTLPAQLRLALAPQGISAAGTAAAGAAANAARVTVRKLIKQRSSGGLGPAAPAAPSSAAGAAGASSSLGSSKAGNVTGQVAGMPGGGGMAAAVSAGLVAAAAAVGGSDGRRRQGGGSGTERQPLLSSLERSTPAS